MAATLNGSHVDAFKAAYWSPYQGARNTPGRASFNLKNTKEKLMVILHEINECTKHDLVILNRGTVAENLEKIVNLLRTSVENKYFSTLTRTQIEQFWRNVSQRIQTAYCDCLHLPC